MLNNYQNPKSKKVSKSFKVIEKRKGPAKGSELMACIAEYRDTGEAEILEAIFSAWEATVKQKGDFYMASDSGHVWASELLPLIADCRSTGEGQEAIFKALEAHYKKLGEFFLSPAN